MPERLCESTSWHHDGEDIIGLRNVYIGPPGPIAWRFFMRMKDCGCETNSARCQKCFDRITDTAVQGSRTRCAVCGTANQGNALQQIVSLHRIFSD
jgi:hypothetical protein